MLNGIALDPTVLAPSITITSIDKTSASMALGQSINLSLAPNDHISESINTHVEIVPETSGAAISCGSIGYDSTTSTLTIGDCPNTGSYKFHVLIKEGALTYNGTISPAAESELISIDNEAPALSFNHASTNNLRPDNTDRMVVNRFGTVYLDFSVSEPIDYASLDLTKLSTTPNCSNPTHVSQPDTSKLIIKLENCSGDQNLTFNLSSGLVKDQVGNLSQGTLTTTNSGVQIDNTAPTITQFSPLPPYANLAINKSAYIKFSLMFSESVRQPTQADFEMTRTDAGSIDNCVIQSFKDGFASNWITKIKGCSDEGFLNLKPGSTFKDIAGNVVPNTWGNPRIVDIASGGTAPFETVWKIDGTTGGPTDRVSFSLLPYLSGYPCRYNLRVDWGDGTLMDHIGTPPPAPHKVEKVYPTDFHKTTPEVTVKIHGLMECFGEHHPDPYASPPVIDEAFANNLVQVKSLGDLGYKSFAYGFANAHKLNYFKGGNVSGVKDMYKMFAFTPSLTTMEFTSDWDTSSVEIFEWMFKESDYAGPINFSTWNFSNTWGMAHMFDTSALNPDLAGMTFTNEINMTNIFAGSTVDTYNYTQFLKHLASTVDATGYVKGYRDNLSSFGFNLYCDTGLASWGLTPGEIAILTDSLTNNLNIGTLATSTDCPEPL